MSEAFLCVVLSSICLKKIWDFQPNAKRYNLIGFLAIFSAFYKQVRSPLTDGATDLLSMIYQSLV